MKKSWKKALLAGLSIVMMGAFIAGCGSDNNGAANKDTLKVAVTNFASTLEPTENFFAWVVMRYGVGETLARFDEQMKPQPWIASKWSVSDDKKTWTFTIDDKVKFSNGKKVDAQAVKESIERTFAKSNRAKTFFEYDSIEANGQDLIIHTSKEYPNMAGLLADPLFLIVDVQSEKDGRNFAKEGPIGTGPYVVKSFTKERAEMVANENYWNGTAPFKTIEIPSIDDPNTRAMALQSGDVDMAVNIGPGEIGLFQNNDKFKVDEIASLRVELKDPNAYNVDRAKQLLAEDGWKDTDGDGVLDKDGKPLTFNFVVYNSRAELPLYAEAVQADLKKIGVDMKIKTVDYNLIDKMGQDGDYDMLINNIVTANTGDPIWFLANYWHTNINGSNPQNGSGYSNPEVDALLDAAETEFDPAKRRTYAIQIQQLLMNDGAALFLGYPKTNIVTGSYLKGAVMFPSDYYWITNKITK